MKLIIQIPCYNEEESLPITLQSLPRNVEGFTSVEWLIIDDGSRDRTAEVARENGVDHVVTFNKNQGLAKAFIAGINACLSFGADVIVNTDADNQYDPSCIADIVKPILDKKADIVIGVRPIKEIRHFSPIKKLLQRLGSLTVRIASNTFVADAPSGFRAFAREAALRLNVFNEYTYTIETLIQAGQKNMAIASVPVRVNESHRPSRLMRSMFFYIKKSVLTIVRIFVVYRPFRFFMFAGMLLFGAGTAVGARFLWFFFSGNGEGHIQSLIMASILIGIGFQTILVAFLADLLAVNRRLLEDIDYRLKKLEYQKTDDAPHQG